MIEAVFRDTLIKMARFSNYEEKEDLLASSIWRLHYTVHITGQERRSITEKHLKFRKAERLH